jgi:hypothetical protein
MNRNKIFINVEIGNTQGNKMTKTKIINNMKNNNVWLTKMINLVSIAEILK